MNTNGFKAAYEDFTSDSRQVESAICARKIAIMSDPYAAEESVSPCNAESNEPLQDGKNDKR